MCNYPDFYVHKFKSYSGPNFFINKQAIIFNIYLKPEGPIVSHYLPVILKKIPDLSNCSFASVIELFAKVLSVMLKLNRNLFIGSYSITKNSDNEWTLAYEQIEGFLSMQIVYFVRDWFLFMNGELEDFNFENRFEQLLDIYEESFMGKPTTYHIIESAIKKNINCHYLVDEEQFIWGYGKNQIRGTNTTLDSDSIQDIQFLENKNRLSSFLRKYGFKSPETHTCFYQDEAAYEAQEMGFPVVLKPIHSSKRKNLIKNLTNPKEVQEAFQKILKKSVTTLRNFEGIIIQKQIPGEDYRLLVVKNEVISVIKRFPPYIIGDGINTIEELIYQENNNPLRSFRCSSSPLFRIQINQELKDYLHKQNLSLDSIPKLKQNIQLREFANISGGAISVDVTEKLHISIKQIIENISKYFKIQILAFDIICKDISKDYQDSDLGIIDISTNPNLFMHIYPGIGQKKPISEIIIDQVFKSNNNKANRIPIIVANHIEDALISKIKNYLLTQYSDLEIGIKNELGIKLGNAPLITSKRHDQDCALLLRNPKLEYAVIKHSSSNIIKYGLWHHGHDIAILEDANYYEYTLKRDLLHQGILIEIFKIDDNAKEIILTKEGIIKRRITLSDNIKNKNEIIFDFIKPYLLKYGKKYLDKSP